MSYVLSHCSANFVLRGELYSIDVRETIVHKFMFAAVRISEKKSSLNAFFPLSYLYKNL